MSEFQTQLAKSFNLWNGYGWYLGTFYSREDANALWKFVELQAISFKPTIFKKLAEDMSAEAWGAMQDALRKRGL